MTEHLCVIDQRRQYERAAVCNGCRLWLDRTLVEIVELYALLPDAVGTTDPINTGEWVDERGVKHLDPVALRLPSGTISKLGSGPRVSGSREAPLPLRVDPLDLMMPARVGIVHDLWRDQTGQVSVATILDLWVRDWRDVRDRGEGLPVPTVLELTRWLGNRLEWACDDHPAVDEFAAEMRRLRGGLAAVVGVKSDRVYVGPCPITDDKGTCGAALTADPYLDIIRCPRCDTMWSRDKWLWLGMTIRAEVA